MSNTFNPMTLGEGKKGHQPLITGHTVGGSERSANRKYLAKAFGNMYNSGLGYSPVLYPNNILGPFRTAYNAGDVKTNSIVLQILNMEENLVKLMVIIYLVFKFVAMD